MRLKKREIPFFRREVNVQEGDGSKRGSLPPKEGDLTCMLKPLYRIQRNLTEGKMYMFKYPLPSLCFSDRSEKRDDRTGL